MPDQSSPAVMWFRRDLRLGDKPALHAGCATADGGGVSLFVVDPSLWGPSGPGRRGDPVKRERWREFLDDRVRGYDTDRDQPGVNGTSHMSVHLKWGEINPRTMLADLTSQPSQGAATYRTSSPGASSMPTSYGADRRPRGGTCAPSSRPWSTTNLATGSRPGPTVAPATRSSSDVDTRYVHEPVKDPAGLPSG